MSLQAPLTSPDDTEEIALGTASTASSSVSPTAGLDAQLNAQLNALATVDLVASRRAFLRQQGREAFALAHRRWSWARRDAPARGVTSRLSGWARFYHHQLEPALVFCASAIYLVWALQRVLLLL